MCGLRPVSKSMFRKKNISKIVIVLSAIGVLSVLAGREIISKNGECRDLSDLTYNQRQECWYREVEKAIERGGVEKGLKLVKSLYAKYPEFASGCHDHTHLIGDAAYNEFVGGKTFMLGTEATYCGYGFYHGFVEAMLVNSSDYSEVKDYCESANKNLKSGIVSPNAIYACYHGIGHSTFDVHNENLWGDEAKMVAPAISTCEKITEGLEEEKTKQCVTGVFNALGIAYSNREYNLELNKIDPVWFCRKQNTLYKKSCYAEVSVAWIYTSMGGDKYDIDSAMGYIKTTGDKEGEDSAIFAVTSDYVRLHSQRDDLEKVVKACRDYPRDMSAPCMEGVVLALLGWGKPGEEYKETIAFCNSGFLNSQEKDLCYSNFITGLKSMYTGQEISKICNMLEGKYKNLCLEN
jgi:hypothetical protein